MLVHGGMTGCPPPPPATATDLSLRSNHISGCTLDSSEVRSPAVALPSHSLLHRWRCNSLRMRPSRLCRGNDTTVFFPARSRNSVGRKGSDHPESRPWPHGPGPQRQSIGANNLWPLRSGLELFRSVAFGLECAPRIAASAAFQWYKHHNYSRQRLSSKGHMQL